MPLLRKEQDEKKRKLSPHVIARWYRPPEVILTEKYNEAVDIWSLGCILAEMLSSTTAYADAKSSERFLFAGASCFPMSPPPLHLNTKLHVPKTDMMRVILRMLGPPQASDLAFISQEPGKMYIEKLALKCKPLNLCKKFPNTSPEMLSLLKAMVEFNPAKRPSARQLLSSTVFDPVRKPEQEENAPWSIHLPLYDGGTFDYENLRDTKYTAKDMHQLLLEEVRLVRQLQASKLGLKGKRVLKKKL